MDEISMKKWNTFIPGAMVMTNGIPLGTLEGVVYRVTVSDPEKEIEFTDGTVLRGAVGLGNLESAGFGDEGFLLGESKAWTKDIVPIPLTAAFLEKNGWKQEDDGSFHRYVDDKLVCLVPADGSWTVTLFDTPLRSIMYVHQFQEVLFGLGLDCCLDGKCIAMKQ